MRKLGACRKAGLVVATLLGVCVGVANATTLWYNGDFDGVTGIANERNTTVAAATTYDDFIIPAGQNWNIQSVWSNDLTDITFNTADWEIRSGVSAGNPGTLLASGTNAASQTATGRSGFGFAEYQVLVTGLNINLGAGTYWLAVAPIDNGAGRSFISSTSGANAVGTPAGNDGNSFYNSSDTIPSGFFVDASGFNGNPIPADFSMGVAGDETGDGTTGAVPEPATLTLLGFGLAGLVARVTRRRNR